MVCHCLLIETEGGLVLIDSGFGKLDVEHPFERLGVAPWLMRAQLSHEQTAFNQIQSLGFKPSEVRHIVLTHLDPDHLGGVSDFPHAQVHVFEEELTKVQELRKTSLRWRRRIRSEHLITATNWQTYKTTGENWKNFECVRNLRGLPPEILLVPLRGHTPGHCGVAVDSGQGWLLHAGDAYFQQIEVSPRHLQTPLWLQTYEAFTSFNNRIRLDNQKKLRALKQDPQIKIFCAHDQLEYHTCQG
jgi:glyoxylase-like metal-dependent hydrolase (beta-lactamase superfamily II)